MILSPRSGKAVHPKRKTMFLRKRQNEQLACSQLLYIFDDYKSRIKYRSQKIETYYILPINELLSLNLFYRSIFKFCGNKLNLLA